MSAAVFNVGQGANLSNTLDAICAALVLVLKTDHAKVVIEPLDNARSLEQNALSHVWYGEIAKQGKEFSTVEARRFCKLTIGVPIMRAHSKEFRAAWDKLAKARFTYEEKLEVMDWWPVTSLMKEAQFTEYLTTMQQQFAGKGIHLTGLERGQEQYPEAAA
jgi:hypothetical protein